MQGDDTNSESAAPVETQTSSPAAETSVSSEASSQVSETSGEQSKETLLDAVLKVAPATPEEDVLAPSKTEEAPSSNEEAESEVKAEDNAEGDEAPEDESVPENIPAQTRKKINKLLRERRTLRDEVAGLRPVAEIGQQLRDYADTNNLNAEDVVMALDLAAMVSRGDYEGFYKVVSPLIRHAQEVTGVVLPPDIQQMVDQRQISPQAAREYAKTRLDNTRYEFQTQQMQQRQQAQQVQAVVGDVQRSVAAFEQRIMANDPDYKAKAEMVRRTAQAMLAEHGGRITSSQEAVAITQRAYEEVNKQFRRLQPTARATAPTPGVSNSQTPSARPAPKNMMEAALQGLAKSRAGRL